MLNMSVAPSLDTAADATANPDLDAFSAAMDEFARAQRRVAGRFNRAPKVPELSTPQFHLLTPLLAAGEPLSVGVLSSAAGVSAPTATRMLDGLLKRGIVTREASREDRRSVLVGLTPHGQELMTIKHERLQVVRAQIFAGLSEDERRGAAQLLRRLAVALEALQP